MRALLGIVLGLLLGAVLLGLLSFGIGEWTADVRAENDLLISGLMLLGVGAAIGVLIESRRLSRTSTLVAALLVAAVAFPTILGEGRWWGPMPAFVEEELDLITRGPFLAMLAGLLLFVTIFAPLRRHQQVDVQIEPAVAPGTATRAGAPPPPPPPPPASSAPSAPAGMAAATGGLAGAAAGGLAVSPPEPSPPPAPVTNPPPPPPPPSTSPPPAPRPPTQPAEAPGWSAPPTPPTPTSPRLPATPPPPGPPPIPSSGTWTAGGTGGDDPDRPPPPQGPVGG